MVKQLKVDGGLFICNIKGDSKIFGIALMFISKLICCNGYYIFSFTSNVFKLYIFVKLWNFEIKKIKYYHTFIKEIL